MSRSLPFAPPPPGLRTTAAPQDWSAIAAYLAGNGHRLEGTPRQFAGGLANLNYLVSFDGAPAVFRRPPAGPLAAGASDMLREAKVLRALAPQFPLVPRLLFLCADPAIIGVPFQLLEFREGVAVGGALPPPLTCQDSGWMLNALTGALSSLHRIDPLEIGLQDLARPGSFAQRQLRGWTRRADAAFAANRPFALDVLLGRLGEACPGDEPARLLHMDAKFDNLLLLPAECRASALIDWDMGTLGPPAFDLAVLLSYWITPDDPPPVHALQAVPSLTPGWPDRRAVIEAYARTTGAIPANLAWHLALARLRLATAWMQLYRLWQQGALVGERYSGFAVLADAIIQQAVDQFGKTA